jgi:hypothetical protein
MVTIAKVAGKTRSLAKGNLDVLGKLNRLKRMPGKPQTRE